MSKKLNFCQVLRISEWKISAQLLLTVGVISFSSLEYLMMSLLEIEMQFWIVRVKILTLNLPDRPLWDLNIHINLFLGLCSSWTSMFEMLFPGVFTF